MITWKKESKRVLEIGSIASTNARLLCRGVDADENEVRLLDGLVHVRGEKEVAATCLFDDVVKAWFIDGEGVAGAIPSINPRLVEVNDCDLDVWALECDDRASRAT